MSKNLADALRALVGECYMNVFFAEEGNDSEKRALQDAEEALAAYDKAAALGLPTDYRVTWEIDAFNATTAREAAEEARAAMTRAHTTATVFTVYGRDGSVTDVDLGEDEE